MKSMRITHEKKVFQLTFLPRFFPVNCYLVEEDDGLTLIDAALPYSATKVIKTAHHIGKPITRILLTHAHDDHTGALDALKLALPNTPVYISKRESKLIYGDKSLEPSEPKTPIRGGVPKRLKTKADVLLQDGDQIGSLLAINAPGHTPGLMAFLDTRNNALIVGDAMQTRGGVAVAGQVQPLFPFPAWATWNKQIALGSVRRLRMYEPTLLATGHGSMLDAPCTAIDRAIAKAERNLEYQS